MVLLANDGPQTVSFVLSPVSSNRRAEERPRKPVAENRAPVAPPQEAPQERNTGGSAGPTVQPVNPNGRIIVESSPTGAQVHLAGRLVGSTPVEVPDVASGTYTVTVEQDGYERWTSSVHVEPGQHQTMHAELNRSPRKRRVGW